MDLLYLGNSSPITSKMILNPKFKISFVLTFFLSLLAIFTLQKIIYYHDTIPSIITFRHNWQNPEHYQNIRLLTGKKITNDFQAPSNRLGTVEVKFETFNQINLESLIFRIKEKGSPNWYYQNTYKTDQFNRDLFFPFGFPIIEDSKNRIYEIEIESIQGTPNDSIALNQSDSLFLTKYSFSKTYLDSHRDQISNVLFTKLLSIFKLVDLKIYYLISALSLILFFLLNLFYHPKAQLKTKTKTKIISTPTLSPKTGILDLQKIFLISISSLIILILSILTILILSNHTEKLEWQIYEFSSVLFFVTLLFGNFYLNKIKISIKTYEKILKTNLLFFIIFIFLAFNQKIIKQDYLLFYVLAFIPLINNLSYSFTRNLINLKGISFIWGIKFFEILLINLISFTSITAYFSIYSYNLDLQIISKIIFIVILFSLYFLYYHHPQNTKVSSSLISVISLIILIPIIWYLSQKLIDSHHYSHYLGPIFDVSKGKSILFDTPSQYGYLSIHFLSSILSQSGISFNSFHLANISIFALFCFLASTLFFKLLKNKFIALSCSLIYITLQTLFTFWCNVIYPSTGPLRFGFALLIIWIFVFLPKKLSYLLSSLIASISLFWSVETAVYTIPAWLFALLVTNYQDTHYLKDFLKLSFKKILPFLIFSLIIFSLIIVKEKPHLQQLPDLLNYFSYTSVFKEDYGTLKIEAYGNHYLPIIILILGLVTTTFFIIKKIKTPLLPLLSFISIHNVAVFSYFISRSHENNIINISGFFLIELVIIYLIITDYYQPPSKDFKKYFLVPLILFLSLYFYKIGEKLIVEKLSIKENIEINQKLRQNLSPNDPELSNILRPTI